MGFTAKVAELPFHTHVLICRGRLREGFNRPRNRSFSNILPDKSQLIQVKDIKNQPFYVTWRIKKSSY